MTTTGEGSTWPIAVTGVGVVTPLADSLAGLLEAVSAGRSSVRPSEDAPVGVSLLDDFDVTKYLNVRGMRVYSRATRLGLASGKLALTDAQLDEQALASEELGVVTASTMGHMETLLDYDRSLWTAGPDGTNPALMPLALPSAPGSAIALSFGAKAFSITLAGASSLDALGTAARLLASGRAEVCMVVAPFALRAELVLASARAGLLAPVDELRIFDRRHAGTALGEASVSVVLETLSRARARGARCRGYVRAQTATFAPDATRLGSALTRAARTALETARVSASDVGLVSSSASGIPSIDGAEAQTILELFGRGNGAPAVCAFKANLGDTADASSLLGAVLALESLRAGTAPPIPNLEQPAVDGLAYATAGTSITSSFALATSISVSGSCSAAILECAEPRALASA